MGSDDDISNTASISTHVLGRSYSFMGDDCSAVDTIDVYRRRHESYAEEEEKEKDDVKDELNAELKNEPNDEMEGGFEGETNILNTDNAEDDVTIVEEIIEAEIELPTHSIDSENNAESVESETVIDLPQIYPENVIEQHQEYREIDQHQESREIEQQQEYSQSDQVQDFGEIELPPITPPAPGISRQQTIAWQAQPEATEVEEIVQPLDLDRLSVSEFVPISTAENDDQFATSRRAAPVLISFPLNRPRLRSERKHHYHFVREIKMTRAQLMNGIITFGDIIVIIKSYFHVELDEFRERLERNSRDALNFMKIMANFLYDYLLKSAFLDSMDFPIGYTFMEKMLFDVNSPLPRDELVIMLEIVGKYGLFTSNYRGDHLRRLQRNALLWLEKFEKTGFEGELTRLVFKAAGIKEQFFKKYRNSGEILLHNQPEAAIIRRIQEHLEL